jgi:release factor glutamine methyltransferase
VSVDPALSVNAALAGATRALRAAGIPDPARDARHLMAHALGVAMGRLTLLGPDPLPAQAASRFDAAVAARRARQPVAQIVGGREFYGRRFRVTRDVLDPRPDTETLVAAALDVPFARVLDLGTGTGAILLSLLAERREATGLGVDVSEPACAVARGNAQALGLAARAEIKVSDWLGAVTGGFDLIVSNPPYIAAAEMPDLAPDVRDWEPHGALTDGGDGLAAYRLIAAQAPAHLRPGGWLMVEIGPTQGAAVLALFQAAGLDRTQVIPDLDGRDRVVTGRKATNPTAQEAVFQSD